MMSLFLSQLNVNSIASMEGKHEKVVRVRDAGLCILDTNVGL